MFDGVEDREGGVKGKDWCLGKEMKKEILRGGHY